MIIKNEKPPAWIWYQVHTEFEINDKETVYAYGDTLYNPAGINVDGALHEHEATHGRQQQAYGGPERWWKQYISNSHFRIEQEVEAYAEQYTYFCNHNRDRNMQAKYLYILGSYLASPLYKGDITPSEARLRIKQCIR